MSVDTKSREFALREAKTKIQWGSDAQEVAALLESSYGVVGAEADAMIEEAFAARRSLVRKKASIRLGFAVVGFVISGIYFGIQLSVGFVRIGFGLILMALLGLASLAAAGSSVHQMITGEASGSVQ
jgi:hypothetical protein